MCTCCPGFKPATVAHRGPYHFMFHQVLFAPSALTPQLFSDVPVYFWPQCEHAIIAHLPLLSQVNTRPMQSGVCSCWLYILFWRSTWLIGKGRKWNMCLGGRCDPAAGWLSRISPCFVCCFAPTHPHTIHTPVPDLNPLSFCCQMIHRMSIVIKRVK